MNRRARFLAPMMTVLTLSALLAVPGPINSAAATVTNSPFSWNPKVSCTPRVVRITDITANLTQQGSFVASSFGPGITTTVNSGDAKRWLTPGTTPPGWNEPGPSCTVTTSLGTTSVFIQINGIERNSLTTEDWSTFYDPTNGGTAHSSLTGDTTFSLFDPAVVPNYSTSCISAIDTTCHGRIHAEIDHDWKAAGYCGTGTVCDNATLASQTTPSSTLIDVQGFVYWDPENLNATWHQFNGWEIHPLTAWKLSNTLPSAPFNVSVSSSIWVILVIGGLFTVAAMWPVRISGTRRFRASFKPLLIIVDFNQALDNPQSMKILSH